MFTKYDENGDQIRRRVTVDCSNDKILTEQSHKDEVNINNIIARHGIDIIEKTAKLRSQEFRFDDVTGNDFTEAMLKVTKAQETFEDLPSQIRKQFNNNTAEFMDFVQNPKNQDALIEMGLAQRIPEPQPISVTITNPASAVIPNSETPPE